MSTVPAPAGDVAVIDVDELTVKPVAEVAPKTTAVVLENPLPVIVTDVPPVAGPTVGDTELTVGAAV